MRKKRRAFRTFLLAAGLLFAGKSSGEESTSPLHILFWTYPLHPGGSGDLSKISESWWGDQVPLWGSAVKEAKKRLNDPLLIVAGGGLAGNPEGFQSEGALPSKVLKKLGVHLVGPGWEELTWGVQRLQHLEKESRANFVVGNLTHMKKDAPFTTSFHTTRGNVGISFTSLLPPWALECVTREWVKDYRIIDPVESARFLARNHPPEKTLTIVLSHLGWRADSLIATLVGDLDLIIESGGQTFTPQPRYVGKTLILACDPIVPRLGILEVTLDNGVINRERTQLSWVEVSEKTVQPDSEWTAWWKGQPSRRVKGSQKVLGEVNLPYDQREDLRAWCQAVASAIKQPTNAPVALVETHLFRYLPSPRVTDKALTLAIPYLVPVIATQMEGKEIRTLIQAQKEGSLPHLGWSGVQVNPGASEGDSPIVMVKGELLDDDQLYAVITTGSLWYRWGVYTGLPRSGRPAFQLDRNVAQLVKEALKTGLLQTPREPFFINSRR